LLETAMIVAGFALFGVSGVVVKASMLGLWIPGTLFFYYAVKNLLTRGSRWLPLAITLLLIIAPTWAVWSLKARGGYVTAYLVSNIILYLLAHTRLHRKRSTWIGIGMLLALQLESQPLWLPPLGIVLAWRWWTSARSLQTVLITAGGALVSWGAFYLLKQGVHVSWTPRVFSLSADILGNLENIVMVASWYVTGNYYLYFKMPHDLPDIFGTIIWISVALATLFVLIHTVRKRALTLELALLLAVLSVLGYCVFLNMLQPRYFMPWFQFVLLLCASVLAALPKKWIGLVWTSCVAVPAMWINLSFAARRVILRQKHTLISW